MAARLGDIAGGAPLGGTPSGGGIDRSAVEEARGDAKMFAESAGATAQHMAMRKSGEAERRARAKRGLRF